MMKFVVAHLMEQQQSPVVMDSRQPSAQELEGAKFQGAHVAKIAAKLSA